MAIFGKNGTQQASGHGTTVIATGTQLVGNLTLIDNLHVDGRIDGDVESEASMVIGSEGHVEGQVRARNVVVSGRVQGSIAAERLEIIAGGVVEGDVHTVDLVIEPGGRFNGSSEILASHETERESGAPSRTAKSPVRTDSGKAGSGPGTDTDSRDDGATGSVTAV